MRRSHYTQHPFTGALAAALACALGVTLALGCGQSAPVAFKLNAVELLKQERLFLDKNESFDRSYATEIGSILTALFGTPDQPRLPSVLADEDPATAVLSLEALQRAAGSVVRSIDHPSQGLFSEHCAHCHGITGDGAGPTAHTLNPYPRDFRLGKFKFKSTPLRSVPTDDDLHQLLIEGIPGSSMPSFRGLEKSERQSLIEYVKYLTMRGQYERFLMAELSNLEQGEPLINLAPVRDAGEIDTGSPDRATEKYLDSMFSLIGEGLVEEVLQRWVDAEANRSAIPPAPVEIAVDHPDHHVLVDEGRKLFYTAGNCAQCHGESAVGNGQLETFDDWTNDWIKVPGVDPHVSESYRDFTAVGALTPRPIPPRNLRLGIYRGGGLPKDLFLRIANGIEGTPMPSAAALSSDQIWALVAYVRSLPFSMRQSDRHLPVTSVNIQPTAR